MPDAAQSLGVVCLALLLITTPSRMQSPLTTRKQLISLLVCRESDLTEAYQSWKVQLMLTRVQEKSDEYTCMLAKRYRHVAALNVGLLRLYYIIWGCTGLGYHCTCRYKKKSRITMHTNAQT